MGSIYASLDFVPSARCSAKAQHPTDCALSFLTLSHALVLTWPCAYHLRSAALFLAMLDYAVAHKDLCSVMAPHAKKLEAWVVEWGCSPGQHVDLYKKALKGKDCHFLVFMGLFALNLPYTHREIDCYFLVFMGLLALN
eukprot:SAG31_NODE_19086_length_612_cov_1.210526_1_plen_138_part_10